MWLQYRQALKGSVSMTNVRYVSVVSAYCLCSDVWHRALKYHNDFISSSLPDVVHGAAEAVVATACAGKVRAVHLKLGETLSRAKGPQRIGACVVFVGLAGGLGHVEFPWGCRVLSCSCC